MVHINNKSYVPATETTAGYWIIDCVVTTSSGTRMGTEYSSIPDTAAEEELKADILAKYEVEE